VLAAVVDRGAAVVWEVWMSVVLLVRDRGGASYVTPQRIRVRDRVAARLRAARLDAELAQGVAPQSSAALELRAQR
jgi:hypothetical protein